MSVGKKTASVSEERNALSSGSANPTRLLHPEDLTLCVPCIILQRVNDQRDAQFL